MKTKKAHVPPPHQGQTPQSESGLSMDPAMNARFYGTRNASAQRVVVRKTLRNLIASVRLGDYLGENTAVAQCTQQAFGIVELASRLDLAHFSRYRDGASLREQVKAWLTREARRDVGWQIEIDALCKLIP